MEFNLLIFGSGLIGCRYIQGMINEKLKYNITVVDSNYLSLTSAKEIWSNSGGDQSQHDISWNQELPLKKDKFDLAIISTTSKGRASLINYISSKVSVNYWVIEKILAQSKQELDLIKFATNKAKVAYVNNPFRLMNWHNKFKSKFLDLKPIKLTVVGGMWNLACCAIHYLDLVSWWTGEKLISINTENLNKIWLESRRKGYYDVTGKLLAKFTGGTELILESYPEVRGLDLIVELSDKNVWTIHQEEGTAVSNKGDTLNGRLEFQSELTGPMVSNILINETCGLPTLHESAQQHEIFLDAMLNHWNISNNLNDKLVPIT